MRRIFFSLGKIKERTIDDPNIFGGKEGGGGKKARRREERRRGKGGEGGFLFGRKGWEEGERGGGGGRRLKMEMDIKVGGKRGGGKEVENGERYQSWGREMMGKRGNKRREGK